MKISQAKRICTPIAITVGECINNSSAKLKRMLNIAKENPKTTKLNVAPFVALDSLAKRQFVAKGCGRQDRGQAIKQNVIDAGACKSQKTERRKVKL